MSYYYFCFYLFLFKYVIQTFINSKHAINFVISNTILKIIATYNPAIFQSITRHSFIIYFGSHKFTYPNRLATNWKFVELFRLYVYLFSSIAFINFSGNLGSFHKNGAFKSSIPVHFFINRCINYNITIHIFRCLI